ncbi:cystin-1 isoform X2 [Manis pentadactyla]|uniref:cystin-1 isoform X2 n=1 Tax=Manis pentadactyla TaxID=143292 RepID=UPI00255CB171|nr:cystin-1 isoform X2 [Manis pentadactyla]
MGSGSSRSGRALRRLRSRDSLPAGPGGTAPDGGTGPLAAAAAAREVEAEAEAEEGADGRHRDPAAPPDGEDDTLRLLDELLAESAAWGAEEPTPRGPARPRPAAGAGSSRLTPTVEVVGLVLSLCDQLDGGCGRSMWTGRGEC